MASVGVPLNDLDGVSHALNAKSTASGYMDTTVETFIGHRAGFDDVAHTLRGDGFDASEDGTGRGTPLVPVGTIAFHARQDPDSNTKVTHPLDTKGNSIGIAFDTTQITSAENRNNPQPGDPCHPLSATAHPLAYATQYEVRRLLPTECEKLMGVPEIKYEARIDVWDWFALGKDHACVERQSLKGRGSASPVVGDVSQLRAESAGLGLNTSHQCQDPAAVLLVFANCERGEVLMRSENHSSSTNVRTAERSECFSLVVQNAHIAHLVALTLQIAAREMDRGKAASQVSTKHSTGLLSGGAIVRVSGREIKEHAVDAESAIKMATRHSTFITSGHGQNIQQDDLILRTLYCSVVSAIALSIPKAIRAENLFSVNLHSVQGYTNIPYRGKPAADGNRYKALGNGFAVPVIRWIAESIVAANAASRDRRWKT